MELPISRGPVGKHGPGLASGKLPSGVLSQLWAENLRQRGSSWGRSVSDSMRPFIAEGDRVLVERSRGEGIGFGEIAVFSRAGQWIIHRVLARRRVSGRDYFVEKGDNNFQAGLVPVSDVVGRVRALEISGRLVPLTSLPARLLQYMLALYSYLMWRWWAIARLLLPPGVKEKVPGRWSRRLCRLPPRVLLRLAGTR